MIKEHILLGNRRCKKSKSWNHHESSPSCRKLSCNSKAKTNYLPFKCNLLSLIFMSAELKTFPSLKLTCPMTSVQSPAVITIIGADFDECPAERLLRKGWTRSWKMKRCEEKELRERGGSSIVFSCYCPGVGQYWLSSVS